jgi:hypothetical protein
MERIAFYHVPTNEPWCRDHGPIFLTRDREPRSATGRIRRGEQSTLREFVRACGEMYRGRLWINRLARAAVLSPRTASFLSHAARVQPVLRSLTAKIVTPN